MRQYILSHQEKEIIKEYLATGKKLDGFKVIVHRAKNVKTQAVNSDLDLIKQFLARIEDAKTLV